MTIRTFLLAALAVAASAAEAHAQTLTDHASCGAYRAKWESIKSGIDLEEMDAQIKIIPSLCGVLREDTQRDRAAAVKRAAQAQADAAAAVRAADPCIQARADWPSVQNASEAMIKAYRESVPPACSIQRGQADEKLNAFESQRRAAAAEAARQKQAAAAEAERVRLAAEEAERVKATAAAADIQRKKLAAEEAERKKTEAAAKIARTFAEAERLVPKTPSSAMSAVYAQKKAAVAGLTLNTPVLGVTSATVFNPASGSPMTICLGAGSNTPVYPKVAVPGGPTLDAKEVWRAGVDDTSMCALVVMGFKWPGSIFVGARPDFLGGEALVAITGAGPIPVVAAGVWERRGYFRLLSAYSLEPSKLLGAPVFTASGLFVGMGASFSAEGRTVEVLALDQIDLTTGRNQTQ